MRCRPSKVESARYKNPLRGYTLVTVFHLHTSSLRYARFHSGEGHCALETHPTPRPFVLPRAPKRPGDEIPREYEISLHKRVVGFSNPSAGIRLLTAEKLVLERKGAYSREVGGRETATPAT